MLDTLPKQYLTHLVEGIMTVLFGLTGFLFLPNTPGDAKFLTEEERAHALGRMREDASGATSPEQRGPDAESSSGPVQNLDETSHRAVDVPVPHDPTVRRGLMVIAKIIQNLANNILFGKEAHMVILNDFLKENIVTVTKFLSEINVMNYHFAF